LTNTLSPSDAKIVDDLKQKILITISGTNNGKTASLSEQQQVLTLVQQLEADDHVSSVASSILLNRTLASSLLNGTWYLQYTQPCNITSINNDEKGNESGQTDLFPNVWKPDYATEGPSKIPTEQVQSQGTIAAGVFTVTTSNRVVQQIFNIETSRVTNIVTTSWGQIQVAGSFRPSPAVSNRAIVGFDSGYIAINQPDWGNNTGSNEGGDNFQQNTALFQIPLDPVFRLVATVRGTNDSGWLETTFVDRDLRIGRGNRGTLFILTRDRDALQQLSS
jgi:hypothetical protein